MFTKSKHKEETLSRDRIKQRLILTKKLWIFLILGSVIFILGIITGGIYFNIQGITTSTQHTEIFPTYIVCLVVIVAGICVVSLVCRRYIFQVYCVIIICAASGLFSGVVSVLIGTQVLRPIISLGSCDFILSTSLCVCSSSYRRENLQLDASVSDKSLIVFERTASCKAIQEVLPALLYSQIGLLLAVLCLCALSALLAYLVLRSEQNRVRLLHEETYDDIFTVSGSSSVVDNDSDDENVGRIDSLVKDSRSVIGKISDSNAVTPVSILKVSDQQNLLSSLKSRKQSGGSENSSDKFFRSFNKSSAGVRRSRSCDSLDDFYKLNIPDVSSSAESSKSSKGQGKLKEHRRRNKRAVTLHNLDTKQLLLILDLHKKYEEETKLLKSQGNLNINVEEKPKVDYRRALTPQPYVSKPCTIPRLYRSHTPQPGQLQRSSSLRKKEDKGNKEFQKEIKDLLCQQSVSVRNDLDLLKGKGQLNTGSKCKSSPVNKQSVDVNCNSVLKSDNSANINMHKNIRSRPSVQKHILPTEPIRRQGAEKLTLPPLPLTRQSSHGDTLPPAPLQRDGSAFYVVGSQLDLSENSKSLKTPGEIRYEKAIRENFKLCKKSEENPYATPKKVKDNSDRTSTLDDCGASKGKRSDNLPPYPNPPSYSDFISISQDESSVRSDSQSTYDTVDPGKSESSDIQNESRDRLLTASSDDEVFVPNSQKNVHNQVVKKHSMPKMGISANLRSPPGGANPPLSVLHSNHVSSNHHHVSSITGQNCVQTGESYHDPKQLHVSGQPLHYHIPPSQIYHHPHVLGSPYSQPKNVNSHFYEEIGNIETSFMYCEDMLPSIPSTGSSSSQAALLPSNKSFNENGCLSPYRPITTLDPSGESLETMI